MKNKKYKVFALSALALLAASILLIIARAPLYWKEAHPDYAPSGMPDFDQRQWGTYNWTDIYGNWSHCAPVAVANSLWWYDSTYEVNSIPPPTVIDNFPLVTAYGPWDDHDPQNVQPLVEHLAYLMDTDGRRTGLAHLYTHVTDMETGLAQYLSWAGNGTINPQGDVNGDGIVNPIDYDIVNASLGSVPGNATWNMAADIWPVTTGWPNQSVADNRVDINDLNLVTANMDKTGTFYEFTVPVPDFFLLEEDVERSRDVIIILGFYIEVAPGEYFREDYPYPYGHAVTVAGVDSAAMQIAISDPAIDAFELGLAPGRSPVPHPHAPPEPPYITHNNASLVSHDIYNVTLNPVTGMWELIGYPPLGPGTWHVLIENAVITSPVIMRHDVAVLDVVSLYPQVDQGDIDPINVTVQNQGDFPETVDVYAFYNESLAAPKQTIPLDPGEVRTLTFDWNTTDVPLGIYVIRANATIPFDDDPIDNHFVDGTQEVIPEFPPAVILPLFMTLSLITVVFKSKKKKQ
ncbi:MAG: hypothetical protein ACE5J6_00240 [Candidatus Bathyarchaeia archaeon]